jgi:hypothetical protein
MIIKIWKFWCKKAVWSFLEFAGTGLTYKMNNKSNLASWDKQGSELSQGGLSIPMLVVNRDNHGGSKVWVISASSYSYCLSILSLSPLVGGPC